MTVSSRAALEAAEKTNAERGDEILGFVSASHGFIPVRPPATSLPPSHVAWDEVINDLPNLFRKVTVRQALQSMPVLDASPDALPDEYLLRATSILSILGHAWVRIEMQDAGEIPPSVLQPWTQASKRMGRSEAYMQYNDLILTNWRMRDPAASDPMAIENLDLLYPTVGNQTEQVFYLTQIEMTAHAAPLVESVVRAQEAMAADDIAGLTSELLLMLDVNRSLVERSFMKIDPNPLSYTHCDPVIWGATVGPFAVSIKEHIRGPGGTANPVFHLMDAFLGRSEYGSQLGDEAAALREYAPPLQQQFWNAVSEVNLRDFMRRMKSRSLNGTVQTLVDAYTGEQGLIAAHRVKAYGFLEVAFKVGRTVTLGGFKGLFRDRPWKQVDAELNITRVERGVGADPFVHHARLVERSQPAADPAAGVTRVHFDVAGGGVVYHPGDRCGVLAENSPELVAKTIEALGADADTVVPLTQPWADALVARAGFEGETKLRLEDFCRFAKLRPVLRPTAKALFAASVSPRLGEILESRAEDQWELWDLLGVIAEDGYDVSRLVSAEAWQAEALAQIVPPELFRMYSVASAPDPDADGLPASLDLTVGTLAYESNGVERRGTASSYLTGTAGVDAEVPIRIVHPRRFRLPDDPATPIVMFSAGTGIAPFRGFMQSRQGEGDTWLFTAARTPGQVLFQSEMDELVAAGRLNVRVATSRDQRLEDLMQEPDNAALLRGLVERGAVVYLCGRPGFAQSVMEALVAVTDRQTVRQLVADRRLMLDVFTAFMPATGQRSPDAGAYDASEVVLHNSDERGWWIVVDGMVYDMTEFVHLHPGGKKIIVESAGMDASREYRAVLHHENSEIEAMLSMYKIGQVRRLRFGGEWGIVLTPEGFEYLSLHDAYRYWVRFLYLVTEMQNALGNDFSYMGLPTITGDSADEVTPYKLMLFGNTHLRFFDHYFHGSLGDDIVELWRITTGLCAPDEPLRALESAVEAALSSDDAAAVNRFSERLRTLYREMPNAEVARALVDAVMAADAAFLESMKMTLRQGVQVFERHEAATLAEGGPDLVRTLLSIPGLATAYYADLIARVGAVAPDLLA